MRYPMTLGVQTLRVLVVDADPKTLESVSAILGELGCHVTCCADGAAALNAVRRFSYDLIVLDLSASEARGHDFIRDYSALSVRHAAVIYLATSDGGDALAGNQAWSAQEPRSLRTYGVLAKPIETDALLEAVSRCAEAARLSRNGFPDHERQAREDDRRYRELRSLRGEVEHVRGALIETAAEGAKLQKLVSGRKLTAAETERVQALERTTSEMRSQLDRLRAELTRQQSEDDRAGGE